MADLIQNFIIVDDDPINNMLCTKMIKKLFADACIQSFTNPDDALTYISSTYDTTTSADAVIFLDINMPILSGWEFLDIFDKFDIGIKSFLKIYMLTSSFDSRDKKRAAENVNVVDYFEKPLNVEKIKNTISIANQVSKTTAG